MSACDVCVQWTMNHRTPNAERMVDDMIALDGDLYVYGGVRQVADGKDDILSDVLVARAHNKIVNQPWKRISISESCSSHNSCRYGIEI